MLSILQDVQEGKRAEEHHAFESYQPTQEGPDVYEPILVSHQNCDTYEGC